MDIMYQSPLEVSAAVVDVLMRLAIYSTTTYWLLSGQHLWFGVGLTCSLLSLLPGRLVRDVTLRSLSGLCLSTLLASHVVLGMEAGLYETSSVYDKLMHLLGSGAITALVYSSLSQYCDRERFELPLSLLSALVLGITVSAGTLWEVFEFTVDQTGLFQAQKGLTDTMLDLVANTLGAMLVMSLFAGFTRSNGVLEPV